MSRCYFQKLTSGLGSRIVPSHLSNKNVVTSNSCPNYYAMQLPPMGTPQSKLRRDFEDSMSSMASFARSESMDEMNASQSFNVAEDFAKKYNAAPFESQVINLKDFIDFVERM